MEIQRSNIKYQADDWISRAEKRLNYALYAQERLLNSTSQEKTEILRNIGSNFLLNAEILYIDLDHTLNIFKNNHTLLNKDLIGLELDNKLLLEENRITLDSWLGARDSNPNNWYQKPESCR